jgi:hypothetical protein
LGARNFFLKLVLLIFFYLNSRLFSSFSIWFFNKFGLI